MYPHREDDDDDDEVEAESFAPALHDPTLPVTATMGGILSLARSLLAQAPLVQNLSLTGSLERIFCGPRAPTALKMLHSLSLGPPQRGFLWTPPLDGLVTPAIFSLRQLRLCGRELHKDEAEAIVEGLPHLEHLQWSTAEVFGDHEQDIAM